MSSEREELEDLIKSPGFLRLQAYQQKFWGDQLVQHIGSAANDINDLSALQKIRQVIAAAKATEALLAWPQERVTRLLEKRAADAFRDEHVVSRRGGL